MTLINFLVAIFLACWGLYLYRTSLNWKRSLRKYEKQLDKYHTNVLAREMFIEACDRDLDRREKVWNDLKDKIEKDSKWKLKN